MYEASGTKLQFYSNLQCRCTHTEILAHYNADFFYLPFFILFSTLYILCYYSALLLLSSTISPIDETNQNPNARWSEETF